MTEFTDYLLNLFAGCISIFMVGLLFCGVVKKGIAPKSEFWASIAYAAILIFAGGMTLSSAQLTDLSDIVIEYVIVGGTVAAVVAFGIGGAIAIGLGGKESVAKYLEKKTKD